MALYLGLDSSTQSLTAVAIQIPERIVFGTWSVNFEMRLSHWGTENGVVRSENPRVRCLTEDMPIGTVTGLVGSGLILDDGQGQLQPIVGNGSFSFATPLTHGSTYDVVVHTPPSVPSQTCVIGNGGPLEINADVNDVHCVEELRRGPAGALLGELRDEFVFVR